MNNNQIEEMCIPAVEIKNFSLSKDGSPILKQINLSVAVSECVAILGKSGSGKTTLLNMIAGVEENDYTGEIRVFGKVPEHKKHDPHVGWLPQGLGDNLNPHMTVEQHLQEAIILLNKDSKHKTDFISESISELMLSLDISKDILFRYSKNLSGGEIQRVLLALVLIGKPKLLLLDEPTASLDEYTKSVITQTLRKIKKDTTLILVTHDSKFANSLADTVVYISSGVISSGDFLQVNNEKSSRLERYERRGHSFSEVILSVENLNISYHNRELFHDFSLNIKQGDRLLIYGKSGSGKSTLAKILSGWLKEPDDCILTRKGKCFYLSQFPSMACAAHYSLFDILAEPMKLSRKPVVREKMDFWLNKVHLEYSDDFLARKPDSLSGGELQRLLLVRALLFEPSVIVADEPTSALDCMIRNEIVSCIEEVQQVSNCAFVIFSHDSDLETLLSVNGYHLTPYGVVNYT
ncbi:ABC transporter ATP-binding protein [Vibrio sp. HA2012]|uniref:ABC transporter ATP-binding protein n=1 Tax=Vibrio sp. HA2012 TaxID=1971595 RepID=UPI0018E24DDA|nr:ATP-binding cassette domain-containing protein [Vibrio sp. HA2012]